MEALCQRASQGDRAAIGELIATAEPHIWPLCWRGTGGRRADAEDVFQEAILRAIRSIARYDPARPFAAWLKGIAANVVADQHRARQARMRLVEGATANAEPPDDDDSPVDEPDRGRVVAALAELPAPTRAVLLLHHGEGFSVAETAQLTGLNLEAVKKRLQRGRAELRERLTTGDPPQRATA